MDPIMTALLNGGGMGLLAAALFYLHTSSLRAFREELAEERKVCLEQHNAVLSGITDTRHAVNGLAHAVTVQTAVLRTAGRLPAVPEADVPTLLPFNPDPRRS